MIIFCKFYWLFFFSFFVIIYMNKFCVNNFYTKKYTNTNDKDDDNDSKNMLTKVKVKSLLSYLFIRLHQNFQWNSVRFRAIFHKNYNKNEWFILKKWKTHFFEQWEKISINKIVAEILQIYIRNNNILLCLHYYWWERKININRMQNVHKGESCGPYQAKTDVHQSNSQSVSPYNVICKCRIISSI